MSGPPASLRVAGPADAVLLLELKHRLDRETPFMMFEPDERDSSAADLAAELDRAAGSPNSVVIVADAGDHLAGYTELTAARSAAAAPPPTSSSASWPATPDMAWARLCCGPP